MIHGLRVQRARVININEQRQQQNSNNNRSNRQQQQQSGPDDLYKILGVKKNANDKEIKSAYRKLALKHHVSTHNIIMIMMCVHV